jgi:hypothetical protein
VFADGRWANRQPPPPVVLVKASLLKCFSHKEVVTLEVSFIICYLLPGLDGIPFSVFSVNLAIFFPFSVKLRILRNFHGN